MTDDTYVEQYCYNCGYYHADASDGNFPEKGCDDYEQPTQGESK